MVRRSFLGPPRGVVLEAKSHINRKKVVARTILTNIVRQVLHKRFLGTPSNHENNCFAKTKPVFSSFHLYLQNDRKLFPMGTPSVPFGMPWAAFWLCGRVLGTGLDFDGFWDSPWPTPGTVLGAGVAASGASVAANVVASVLLSPLPMLGVDDTASSPSTSTAPSDTVVSAAAVAMSTGVGVPALTVVEAAHESHMTGQASRMLPPVRGSVQSASEYLLVQTAREFSAGEACINITQQETMALGCLLIRHYCLAAYATAGDAYFTPFRSRSLFCFARALWQIALPPLEGRRCDLPSSPRWLEAFK